MHASKKNEIRYESNEAILNLRNDTIQIINNYLATSGLSAKEKDELVPKIQKQNVNQVYEFYQSLYQISYGSLQITKTKNNDHIQNSINKYSIFPYKQEILKLLNLSRVLCVVSQNGTGKTTQVSY